MTATNLRQICFLKVKLAGSMARLHALHDTNTYSRENAYCWLSVAHAFHIQYAQETLLKEETQPLGTDSLKCKECTREFSGISREQNIRYHVSWHLSPCPTTKGLFPLLDASIDSLPHQECQDNREDYMCTIAFHSNETKENRTSPTYARKGRHHIVFIHNV